MVYLVLFKNWYSTYPYFLVTFRTQFVVELLPYLDQFRYILVGLDPLVLKLSYRDNTLFDLVDPKRHLASIDEGWPK